MIVEGRLLNRFVRLSDVDPLTLVFMEVTIQTCFKRHFFHSWLSGTTLRK